MDVINFDDLSDSDLRLMIKLGLMLFEQIVLMTIIELLINK